MSLADELKTEHRRPPGNPCGTCEWYENLDAADKADFDAWLAGGKAITALWRACRRLTDHPYTQARCSFSKHVAEHHVTK